MFRTRLLPLLSISALLVTGALYASGAFAFSQQAASVGSGFTLCAKGNNLSYSASGSCASNATALVVAANADAQALASDVATLQGQVSTLQNQVSALQTLLAGVTRTTFYGSDTLQFSGLNLQLVNGTGQTETTNALGNLIIGYDEFANTVSGSHNLILGKQNSFSAYGGLVAGQANTISGHFASVSGGRFNTASGIESSVSGGNSNTASGSWSSILGDYGITVSTDYGHSP